MRNKKKAAVAAVALVGLSGTGIAYAYWSTGGSGSGTAATGTVASVTVNQTSAVAAMYPGQSAQALSGDFDNPNSGPVFITSVTAVVRAFSSQSNAALPACTAADYAITGTSSVNGSGTGSQVASGSGVGSWNGLSVQLVNNPAANQDNCKNVTITIDYTAV